MQFIKINMRLLLLINNVLAIFAAYATLQQNVAASVANLTQVNFKQTLAADIAAAEEAAEANTEQKILLSRKRRYLVFPEGSSFQLVYDGIIGVVDYTNYLILGITVALAWQLPSKPPSEQLEDIRTRLKDGTLGLTRNDTINNIEYSDAKAKAEQKPTYESNAQTQSVPLPSAARATAGNRYSYKKTNKNLISAFHAPMHHNYYYYAPKTRVEGGTWPKNYYYGQDGGLSGNRGQNNYSGGQSKIWPRRKDNYYYFSKKRNPFAKWTPAQTHGYTPSRVGGKYPWWNLASRLSNSLRGKPRPATTATNRMDSSKTKTQITTAAARARKEEEQQQQRERQQAGYNQSTAARKHRIFPVFGKRSVTVLKNSTSSPTVVSTATPAASDSSSFVATNHSHQHKHHEQQQQQQQPEQQQQHQHHHHRQRRSGIVGPQLTKLDRIHIRHHRNTRQTLYEKIAKYLDKRGSHGQHCVLRALCETGQKSHEHAPGSFVGEIMRTIFTLPEAVVSHEGASKEELQHHKWLHIQQQPYDEAHAYDGDCASRYKHCKDSLWTSEFVV